MTPTQWAREAMENAVRYGGLEKSIADAVERAIREDRAEYVREKEKVA